MLALFIVVAVATM